MSEFSDELRRLGLSQRRIADLAGVSQPAVSGWLTGTRQPAPGTVATLDEAAGAGGRLLAAYKRDNEGPRPAPEHERPRSGRSAPFIAQCELVLLGAGFSPLEHGDDAGWDLTARTVTGDTFLIDCRTRPGGLDVLHQALGKAVLAGTVRPARVKALLMLARHPDPSWHSGLAAIRQGQWLRFEVVSLADPAAPGRLRTLANR